MITYNPIINTINYNGIDIGVLRLDLIHPEVSGNKWFKLKYNIIQAQLEGKKGIITFGGAYSNHIAATAFACKLANVKCIGIIRGDEVTEENHTLIEAQKNGMQFIFVSRSLYKQKDSEEYLNELQNKYPEYFIVPEGGNNELGIKGCEEILSIETNKYNTVFCACGTGATFKGIANSLHSNQKLFGINVLKYEAATDKLNATILNHYHFGGYAKHTSELLSFKSNFEITSNIPLDYVYTSKLCFAVFNLIDKGQITSQDKPLIIHSGGLQGNLGYESRYKLNV